VARHIGPGSAECREMLGAVGAASLDALMDEAIPASIRLEEPLGLPPGISEEAFLAEAGRLAARNRLFKSYIGLGYYNCTTPPVILRHVLENPGWYPPYTPYNRRSPRGGSKGCSSSRRW